MSSEGPKAGKEPKYGEIPTNPYDALGVTPDLTKDEIRSAYRKLTQKYHPDKNIEVKDPEAQRWYEAVTEAYQFIMDPKVDTRTGHYFKNFVRPVNPYRFDGKSRKQRARDKAKEETTKQAEKKRKEEEDRAAAEAEQARKATEDAKNKEKSTEPPQGEASDESGENEDANAGSGEQTENPPEDGASGTSEENGDPNAQEAEQEPNTGSGSSTESGAETGSTAGTGAEGEPAAPDAESINEIDAALTLARSAYVKEFIAWKNENRAKRGKIAKLASTLSFEKQVPVAEMSQAVKDAEAAYMQAKKRKNESVLRNKSERRRKTGKGLGLEEYQFNPDMLNLAEKEYELLQQQISESIPPLQKDILERGLEGWSKLSPATRRVISTVLLTAGAWATGGVGLGALLTYGMSKFVRSTISAGIAQGVGKGVDMYFKSGNKKSRKEVLDQYGKDINMDNFEEKERALMQDLDKEKNKLKKQRLIKAGAMILAGGAAGYGLSGLEDSSGGSSVLEDKESVVSEVTDDNGEALEENDKFGSFHDGDKDYGFGEPLVPPGTMENVPEDVFEAKVELSSKGFIDDFVNLKAKIVEHYGADNIPEQYKHFVETSPTKLAQEFGFYDPAKGLSGMGLKGESLDLDAEGNLVYERIGGTKEVMFDAKTGEVRQFSGKMTSSKEVDVSPTPESAIPVEEGEKNTYEQEEREMDETTRRKLEGNEMDGSDPMPDAEPEAVSQEMPAAEALIQNPNRIPFNNSFVEIVSRGDSHALVYNGTEIAHDHMLGSGDRMVLDPQYMDGEQYKEIRQAFSQVFNGESRYLPMSQYKNIKDAVDLALPFEGGTLNAMLYPSDGVYKVDVFLNGREMAHGVLTDGGPKIELLKNLKGGWFSRDTVYERAFKTTDFKDQMNTIVSHMKAGQPLF